MTYEELMMNTSEGEPDKDNSAEQADKDDSAEQADKDDSYDKYAGRAHTDNSNHGCSWYNPDGKGEQWYCIRYARQDY